jgi:CheY-like chemotaxis protein
VVVTDINLPEGEPHGLALARMIKNKKPHVPIILMTAHPELLNKEVALPGSSTWRAPARARARSFFTTTSS